MKELIIVGLLMLSTATYADEPWVPKWTAPNYGEKQIPPTSLKTNPEKSTPTSILCTEKKDGIWTCSNQKETE